MKFLEFIHPINWEYLFNGGAVQRRKITESPDRNDKGTEHDNGAMSICSGFIHVCKVHERPLISSKLTFKTNHCIISLRRFLQSKLWRNTLSNPPRMTRVTRAHLHGQIFSDLCNGPFARPFRNALQDCAENEIAAISAVIPEAILIQIGLQIAFAYGVVHAAKSVFYETPESFNGLGVNVSHDVNLLTVLNAMMGIALVQLRDSVVNRKIISKDNALWQNTFLDNRENGLCLNVWSDLRDYTAATFCNTEHRSLAISNRRASTHSTFPATLFSFYVGLIHLYRRSLQL